MSAFVRRAASARRHMAAMQDASFVREAEANVQRASKLTEADFEPAIRHTVHFVRRTRTACGLEGVRPNTSAGTRTVSSVTCAACREALAK